MPDAVTTAVLPIVSDDKSESATAWALSWLGTGAVLGAIYLAIRTLTTPAVGDAAEFADVQTPIGWTIVVAGVLVSATTGPITFRRIGPGAAAIVLAVVGAAWLMVFVVASTAGIFVRERFEGSGHSFAVTAVWMSLIGMPVASTLVVGMVIRPEIGFGRGPKATAAVTFVVPLALAVIASTSWSAAESGVDTARTGEITVSVEDVHPWPRTTAPAGIALTPKRITTDTARKDDITRGLHANERSAPVGGGFFTGLLEMINADTGTVRWRVSTPGDRDVTTVVDQRASLVLISDVVRAGGPMTSAIDADTGRIRWTRPIALTSWEHRESSVTGSVVSADVIATVSDDGRTITAINPVDGADLWRYDVGRECAIGFIETSRHLTLHVGCADTGIDVRFLNPTNGQVESARPSFGLDEFDDSLASIADRFEPKVRTRPTKEGGMSSTATAVVETATRRTVLKVGVDGIAGIPDTCAVDGSCLVSTTKGKLRIVSLVDPTVSVPVDVDSDTYVRGAMWLTTQIVFVTDTAGSESGATLVVVDRRTGRVETTAVPNGDLFATGDAVIVRDGTKFVRFERATR